MSQRLLNNFRVTRRAYPALLILLLILPVWAGSQPIALQQNSAAKPTVILISLDGFRWDYLDKYEAPNLKKIAARGVRTKALIPVFPSETFPNHYSIVTGAYPENNGIVKNSFYDPAFGDVFTMSGKPTTEGRWWGAEPIWITAEKQGQISALYFWPGSEAEIEGKRATFWKPYDGKVPNADRVKEVLSWLALPVEKRPTFVSLYMSDVDSAGHRAGPDSPEVRDAVQRVDGSVGELVAGLDRQGLTDRVNIIVVSDHGMAATSRKNTVYLEDYVSLELLQPGHQFTGPNGLIWPMPGKESEVFQALAKVPHMTAYRKENTPEYFHYRNNARIAPIVFVTEEGWNINLNRRPPNNRNADQPQNLEQTTGTHGYDPRLPSMHGIFIAAGPAIKQAAVIDPFENIQIYNLMAQILGLKPAANNGNPAWTRVVLKDQKRSAAASQMR